MQVSIKPLHDNSAWDGYVLHHEHGTIYHLSAWRRAIEKTFKHRSSYSVASNEEGAICGILPLFSVRTLFSGKKIVSIPFAMYGGILADSSEIEERLFRHAKQLQQEHSASYLEFRCLHDPKYDLPRNELYVTYCRELAEDDDAILKSIPRKSRASVRNGYKKFNLSARFENDLDQMYRLYTLNKRNLGSPAYPRAFFEHLVSEFGDDAGMLFIDLDATPIASVLYFWFKDAVVPYFSGADKDYYRTNASNVMYYELMKHARQRGVRVFDFGRSRKGTGAASFKEYMGFEPTPLNYYYSLRSGKDVPDISPSNKSFGAAIKLWSKLPLAVTNFIGPRIVKYIP